MRHRDGLAPDFRALAPPGDSIAWRNDEATRPAGFGRFRVGIVVAALLGLAWIWLLPDKAGMATLLATFALSGGAMILAISVVDRAFANAVVVATDRVLWRQCRPGAPIHSIPRPEITGATVFDESRAVLLHGAAGREQRFTGIKAPRDMALSLGVRVEVWTDRGDPGHGGGLSRGVTKAGYFMAATMFSGAGYGLFMDELPTLRTLVVTLFWFVGAALLYFGGHWLRARGMDDRQRRETACHLLDPIWRGRDPYTGGAIPWWEVPAVTLKLWLARHIYGGPHDCRAGLEPLVYEPGSKVSEPRRESA